MKALVQTGYGFLRSNLAFRKMPTPSIGADEVLIKVYYASINPHDYKVVQGAFKRMERLTFPALVGSDFSGEIIRVGQNVESFVAGDLVFGTADGAIAEFCTAAVSHISLLSRSFSFEKMAALPVVGMTTIQAFNRIGGITVGDKILIHAGSGGVGSFAIQYAKSKRALVYTTTSTKNVGWVKELGADVVIDYTKESYLDVCQELDIVFDTLGGDFTFNAFRILRKHGKIVSILPAEMNYTVAKELGLPKVLLFYYSFKLGRINKLCNQHQVQYEFVFMHPNSTHLYEITTLVENRCIEPIIEKVYEFDEAIDALNHLSDGHVKGKLTIKINNDEAE